jgi:predicted DNA-binding ribbon-helix-helix protein
MLITTARRGARQRYIRVDGHRTSVRLEEPLWQALREIAAEDGLTVNEVCSRVHRFRRDGTFTSALRVYIVDRIRDRVQARRGQAVQAASTARA